MLLVTASDAALAPCSQNGVWLLFGVLFVNKEIASKAPRGRH